MVLPLITNISPFIPRFRQALLWRAKGLPKPGSGFLQCSDFLAFRYDCGNRQTVPGGGGATESVVLEMWGEADGA